MFLSLVVADSDPMGYDIVLILTYGETESW